MPTDSQTLSDLSARVALLESNIKIVASKAGATLQTATPSAPIPPVEVPTPTPTATPASPQTKSPVPIDATKKVTKTDWVQVSGNSISDIVFADNIQGPALIMIRGKGGKASRVQMGRFPQYGIYVEDSTDVVLEDIVIHGYSDFQSNFRSAGKSGGVVRRCWFINPEGKGKANFRGEGNWTFEDCWSEGLTWGMNPLAKGDGGQGWGLDRCVYAAPKGYNSVPGYIIIDNADEVRKLVIAASKTQKDSFELAKLFRSKAKITLYKVDPNTKKTVGEQRSLDCSDDQLRQTAQKRIDELAARSSTTYTRCTNKYGFSVEAGSVHNLDGTNYIEDAAGLIRDYALDYPEPDWTLPNDTHRPMPVVTGNGDVVKSAKGLGVPDDVAKKIFKGWFMVNDSRVDFGK